jgi:hypothetical protein
MEWSILLFVHLVGVSLSVGAATVKLFLLLKSRYDYSFIHSYIQVAKPVTLVILTGLILLILSGIGWLLLGYPLTNVLILKLLMVGFSIVCGSLLGKVVEPKFDKLLPSVGLEATVEFTAVQKQYITFEFAATGTFYAIIILWVFFS